MKAPVPDEPNVRPRPDGPFKRHFHAAKSRAVRLWPALRSIRVSGRSQDETSYSPEAGAETPALLLSTSISLPPGSVETAALRQEQAPAPVSVSWLRVVQQTHRVLAHDGIPAIELTIWRSRWPGCSPRRSSSCGGRGTIPSDGERSCAGAGRRDRLSVQAPRVKRPLAVFLVGRRGR
jgi:hypothetical protein